MIVVTGASRGLGKAITERLTKIGHKVIGLARSNSGLDIEIIKCDVSDYESVKHAALKIKKTPGAEKTSFLYKFYVKIYIFRRWRSGILLLGFRPFRVRFDSLGFGYGQQLIFRFKPCFFQLL